MIFKLFVHSVSIPIWTDIIRIAKNLRWESHRHFTAAGFWDITTKAVLTIYLNYRIFYQWVMCRFKDGYRAAVSENIKSYFSIEELQSHGSDSQSLIQDCRDDR